MTDEAKAMASVNPDMEVEVNMTATLVPMFVDGASHVVLIEGDEHALQQRRLVGHAEHGGHHRRPVPGHSR